MTRSVVATGKVEPITKVEIKSKANGIIERLLVDVDQVVQPGQVLAELDKENLTARLREARANLQAAEAAREAAAAQLKKNEIEAEAPDVAFARRNHARAEQLFEQKLVSQSALDEAQERARAGREPPARGRRAAGDRAGAGRRGHGQRRAGAGRGRARRGGAGQRHHQGADPRHGADARRRGRQPGVVDPQPRRQRHAGDDARRHRAGVRARQGGRGRHRPRAAGPDGEDHHRDVPRQASSRAASRRSRRSASRRTTSPPSRWRCRSTTPARS